MPDLLPNKRCLGEGVPTTLLAELNAFLIYFSYGQRDEARNRHTCTYIHYEAGRGEQARTHMQQLTSNATRRKLSTTALWESTGSSVALPPEEQAKGGKASSERRPLLFKWLVPWPLGPKCSHCTYLPYPLNACWTLKVEN